MNRSRTDAVVRMKNSSEIPINVKTQVPLQQESRTILCITPKAINTHILSVNAVKDRNLHKVDSKIITTKIIAGQNLNKTMKTGGTPKASPHKLTKLAVFTASRKAPVARGACP